MLQGLCHHANSVVIISLLQVEVRNGDLLLGSTPELAMTMSRTQSARAQEKHREKHPDPRIRYWVRPSLATSVVLFAACPPLTFASAGERLAAHRRSGEPHRCEGTFHSCAVPPDLHRGHRCWSSPLQAAGKHADVPC